MGAVMSWKLVFGTVYLAPKLVCCFSLPCSAPSPLRFVLSFHTISFFPFPSSSPFPSHPVEACMGPSGVLGLVRSLTAGLRTAAPRLRDPLWPLSGDTAPPPLQKEAGYCMADCPLQPGAAAQGEMDLAPGSLPVQIMEHSFCAQTQGPCWNNNCTGSSLFS